MVRSVRGFFTTPYKPFEDLSRGPVLDVDLDNLVANLRHFNSPDREPVEHARYAIAADLVEMARHALLNGDDFRKIRRWFDEAWTATDSPSPF